MKLFAIKLGGYGLSTPEKHVIIFRSKTKNCILYYRTEERSACLIIT